jgi:hypothetical protein
MSISVATDPTVTLGASNDSLPEAGLSPINAQLFLLGVVERRAHHLAADACQVGKHLVRRHFLDQQEQSDVSRSAITV